MANGDATPRTGVLLANLGTPAAPTARDVRRFLDEFLSDPMVVRAPRWLWLPLLRGVILPLRAPRSARAYAKIWTPRGSPLLAGTLDLAAALGERLGARYPVAVGMRYGSPTLADGLARLDAAGVERIVVAPLYPQHSGTTTGTTLRRIEELARARRIPAPWVALPSFPDDPAYVAALAARIAEVAPRGAVDRWVFSFHGLPEDLVRRGDPYAGECERTAAALARRLGLADGEWTLAYQSRFGPARWLGPATKEVLLQHARAGARVAVAMPGFAVECLETLEEVGLGLAEEFERIGGRALVVVPVLQDHPLWIEALARLVARAESGAAGARW